MAFPATSAYDTCHLSASICSYIAYILNVHHFTKLVNH